MRNTKKLWKTARWTMCGTLSILLALQGVPTAALAEDALAPETPVITQEEVVNDAQGIATDPQAAEAEALAQQEAAPVADPAAAAEDEATVEVVAPANANEDVEVPLDGAQEVPAEEAKAPVAPKPLAMDGYWALGDYGTDGTQATYTFTLDKAAHVKVELKNNTTANVEYELTNEAGDVQHAKGKYEENKPAIDANLEAGTYKLVVRTDIAMPAAETPEAFGIRATKEDVVAPEQGNEAEAKTAAEPQAEEKAEEAKPAEETKPAEEAKPAAEEQKTEAAGPNMTAQSAEKAKPEELVSAIPSVIPKSDQAAKPQTNAKKTAAKTTAKKANTETYDLSKAAISGLGNNGLSTSACVVPAVYCNGRRLVPNRDFVYAFQGNFQSSCRVITVKFIARGIGRYYGTMVRYYRVVRAFSRLSVRAYGRVTYRSRVRRRNVWVSNPIRYWNAAGAVRYYKVGGSSRLSINARTGKIMVRRGTARGTYRIRVCVQSAGTWNTMKGYRYVTCKVVVR